jgi:hypothetical protein
MKYDFKGPKIAFQNIIFKEYLNLVHKNGQSYEITPFLWFLLMFTPIFGYGPGSGTLELRIRQKFRIHNTDIMNADPKHWRQKLKQQLLKNYMYKALLKGTVSRDFRPSFF